MSDYNFDPEIMQDFLTESGELLEQLEVDLVSLESRPSDLELLNQIFRALHTIKGSASFLALTNLVAIAHSAESALNTARNGDLLIGKEEMDLLLDSVDILKIQFDELTEGTTDLTPADPDLIRKLTILGEGGTLNHAGSDTNAANETTNGFSDSSSSEHTEYADGRTVTFTSLDASKLDLIEHLATDIDESISQATDKLNDLLDQDSRSSAGLFVSEMFEEIARTVDFFEIKEIVIFANSLAKSLEGIDSLTDDHITQIVPRLHGMCLLLNEQTKALVNQQIVSWPADTLIERISVIAEGGTLSEGVLSSGCDPYTALKTDGIPYGSDEADSNFDETQYSAAEETEVAESVVSNQSNTANQTELKATKKGPANIIEQTIRVEVSRLESLMNLVGELVLQKNRIGAMSETLDRVVQDAELMEQIEITASTLDRVTGDIQLAVMRTRMQPLDKLFGKYPRLIRDLATKTEKMMKLEIIGGDTEVDKSVIEELGDPLVHLLRNSADHGIETPADRLAAGKDETGTIQIVAGHQGSHVSVQIIDNGKGLNRDTIGQKAVERGLISMEQLPALSNEEVFRFILEPGFSTADEVSDLSGRGVGMDVVRTNIESKLKGTISIDSVTGEGTTINISIPLTVAIMPAMMVAVSDEVFAIPLTNITEIVHPSPEMLSELGDEPVIHLRGSVYPLISSQEVFNVAPENRTDENFVVVIGFNQRVIGLRVSRVIGQQEIVIKPLDGVQREGPLSGATVRNDGGVSLIMDIAELMRVSRNQRGAMTGAL
ncbi:MAG: chemotaxis protein CheA [Phycisphaerales bacterium]|nr:chemotaxis protein CheA [Phycisphaerales bacterium]